MSNQSAEAIQTVRLAGSFGVDVKGIDLSQPLSADVAANLRRLFFEHRLLLFRDQDLSLSGQIDLMSVISRVIVEPERSGEETRKVPTEERFSLLSNKRGTRRNSYSEFAFHADYMFAPHGAYQAISLWADTMDQPAQTIFADMVEAARRLPPALRKRVESLYVVNLLKYTPDAGTTGRHRLSSRKPGQPDSMFPRSVHPIIERHVVTGEYFLDVSEFMTSHVLGWDDDASEELFEELQAIAYAEDRLYTTDWRLHDLIIWDNIALQHKREAFPGAGERTLRRVIANPFELGTMMAAAQVPEASPGETYSPSGWGSAN